GRLARPTPADGIVQAPGHPSVLVANAEDKVVYFYKEGMAAPMGHFQSYGKVPRAVLVVDRSLRETRPGIYETVAQMGPAGQYVAVRLKITDPVTRQARKGLRDVQVLTFLSPGTWQQRQWADEVAEGV